MIRAETTSPSNTLLPTAITSTDLRLRPICNVLFYLPFGNLSHKLAPRIHQQRHRQYRSEHHCPFSKFAPSLRLRRPPLSLPRLGQAQSGRGEFRLTDPVNQSSPRPSLLPIQLHQQLLGGVVTLAIADLWAFRSERPVMRALLCVSIAAGPLFPWADNRLAHRDCFPFFTKTSKQNE